MWMSSKKGNQCHRNPEEIEKGIWIRWWTKLTSVVLLPDNARSHISSQTQKLLNGCEINIFDQPPIWPKRQGLHTHRHNGMQSEHTSEARNAERTHPKVGSPSKHIGSYISQHEEKWPRSERFKNEEELKAYVSDWFCAHFAAYYSMGIIKFVLKLYDKCKWCWTIV